MHQQLVFNASKDVEIMRNEGWMLQFSYLSKQIVQLTWCIWLLREYIVIPVGKKLPTISVAEQHLAVSL